MTRPPSNPSSNPPIEAALKAEAGALGFVQCGIARADAIPGAAERLAQWLALGSHGSMGWMADRSHQRGSPAALWPEVRSVVMLGMSYAPAEDPMKLGAEPAIGRFSAYARGQDYHDVVKRALKALARWLVERAGGDVKVFVDTAPVMEKPLAAAAGLGWQGKHTNLVSRQAGSWLLLGAIMTTLDLAPDPAGGDRCGSCDACQRACPTDAFPAPYQLDARRCISYLTIEHKGPIPAIFREAIGNRVYGCDDCLAVCPWNKFAEAAQSAQAFHARAELAAPEIGDLLSLDDAGFRAVFAGSPIKRIGRDRMVRNALVGAGNSGLDALAAPVAALLDDPAPVVRGTAAWALGRLDPLHYERERILRLELEPDASVRDEWV
ncbi:tRNA epoxyqueuosine(34) reductase QueG [Sphingomonas naphthae]|uniref:Epoxyqueuosine reductase n=1 Tax=Sphingomonas naphthae TaxID=1813468 RepID=A0ABY7TLH7_9SPHN|nr:tRNA epoxyqueuosine(34) reductase QueG [Sphingomonas naphthae]WCT72714.1 tRNA epoxyqueuosine(34) reductase QueG [Sphingomonas naphthae]